MKQSQHISIRIDSSSSWAIFHAFIKLSFLNFLLASTLNLNAQITSACGIYTGTGATKTFTNLGFDPDVVIIKANAATFAYIKTTTMGTNKSASTDGASLALRTDAITALGTGGFTISTNADVNTASTIYYFYAFKANANVEIGSYTGDGAGSRTITTTMKVGWAVTVSGSTVASTGSGSYMSPNTTDYIYCSKYNSGSASTSLSGGTSPTSGFICSGSTNVNTATYYYFALKEVASVSEVNTYSGTGATQTITPSITPKFVVTQFGTSIGFRSSVSPSLDATQILLSASADLTQRIQSVGTTAKFVVGTNANTNGSGSTYNYFALGNSTILPVELTEFSGTCASNEVQLSWTTATELNNDYFLIEKSTDGYHWIPIDKVKGSRHSITATKYISTDDAPNNGLVYYRLSQVDIDGKVTVFKAIDVDCNMSEGSINHMILFPNPSTTELNAQINASRSSNNNTLSLVNNLGQVIFEKKINIVKGANVFYFPIEVASGSYTVLFSSDHVIIPSQKLMIINQ